MDGHARVHTAKKSIGSRKGGKLASGGLKESVEEKTQAVVESIERLPSRSLFVPCNVQMSVSHAVLALSWDDYPRRQ